MSPPALLDLLRVRPFRPLRFKTSAGRDVMVNAVEAVAYGGDDILVVVLPANRIEILDVHMIESVEVTG
jgi:hypothetical protein